MGDIDHAHDAENEREAEGGERQDEGGDSAFEQGEEEMRAEAHGAELRPSVTSVNLPREFMLRKTVEFPSPLGGEGAGGEGFRERRRAAEVLYVNQLQQPEGFDICEFTAMGRTQNSLRACARSPLTPAPLARWGEGSL